MRRRSGSRGDERTGWFRTAARKQGKADFDPDLGPDASGYDVNLNGHGYRWSTTGLQPQELLDRHSRLFDYRSHGAFRQIARMIGDCGISVCGGTVPDLVASGGLSVEREACLFQAPDYLPIPEIPEPSHRLVFQYKRQFNSLPN